MTRNEDHGRLEPSPLLTEYLNLFSGVPVSDPILDLASGEGHNGVSLARMGHAVICCDRSADSLSRAEELAGRYGVRVELWQVDLEEPGINPLPEDRYGGLLVFRYLHRPLIPCIKKALKDQGLLVYETYTVLQPRFGRPHNPDFLLRPGELRRWFEKWDVIHYFEGVKDGPRRAVAQLVCRKPA